MEGTEKDASYSSCSSAHKEEIDSKGSGYASREGHLEAGCSSFSHLIANLDSGRPSQTPASNTDNSLKKASHPWQIKGNYHLKQQSRQMTVEATAQLGESESEFKSSSPESSSRCAVSQENSIASEQNFDDGNSPPNLSLRERYENRPEWPMVKWQTRQVAKAFVDNTINCVLEDMGFVPMPTDSDDVLDEAFSSSIRRTEQHDVTLEDEAVLMAIQSHGLHRSDQHLFSNSIFHPGRSSVGNMNRETHHCSFSHLHCDNPDLQYHKVFQRSSPSTEFTKSTKAKATFANMTDLDLAGEEIKNILPVHAHDEREGSSNSENFESTPAANCDRDSGKNISQGLFLACTCPIGHLPNSSPWGASTLPATAVNDVKDEQEVVKRVSCSGDSSAACPCLSTMKTNPQLLTFSSKRQGKETVSHNNSKRQCRESSDEEMESQLNSVPSLMLVSSHNSKSADELVSKTEVTEEKPQPFEHFDFMDAAVAVAIQKKGLSAMTCTEYG